ncbi:hypothetical protein [Pseudomonas sp. NBRC 111118]|uniref:hypothetical protein n=1 Tax=Pseudomonas sp. NBRC 111118 TaxID=1661033 RepID=UPI000AEFA158|nr:hypothetical protein [Pseudomonas sp. NBRC 111118]
MRHLILSTLAASVLSTFSTLASASFEIKIPLEASAGGLLANGSISMGQNQNGSNGSNQGGNGTDTGTTEPTDPTTPTEPTDPEEQLPGDILCQINTQKASAYMFSTYPDVQYSGFNYVEETKTCIIQVSIPKAKTASCGYGGNYIAELKTVVFDKYSIDGVSGVVRGICSDSSVPEYSPI